MGSGQLFGMCDAGQCAHACVRGFMMRYVCDVWFHGEWGFCTCQMYICLQYSTQRANNIAHVCVCVCRGCV